MKRIDSGYKLIEVLSGRRGSAETGVDVATVKFRFGAVVLIEKLVFNVAYEKISVAGSHFSTHGSHFSTHDSLRRRANARNVSFRISLRWLIHIINSVDKIQLSRYTSHRRSTTVSLETYPSITLILFVQFFQDVCVMAI